MVQQDRAVAGQAVYTPGVLSIYDWLVLSLSNRYIWKCPTQQIEAHYNRHLSANHLDVGVGTGYFLDRCRFPSTQPRIALMDMNSNTLVYALSRIARYQPETYQQNILLPLEESIAPFDSIGVNYLLHCLPGVMAEKTILFDHLRPLMKPGCRVFGSTLLQGDVPRGGLARWLMRLYNRKAIFSNEEDTVAGLRQALTQRFVDVEIEVIGCVALFAARFDAPTVSGR